LGLFGRKRSGRPVPSGHEFGRGGFAPEDREHLRSFLSSRRGVEAYIEPVTTFTPCTVVLVAHDGEWTRRACEEPDAARDLAAKASIPIYEVAATGYPSRMREWTAARKRAGEQSPVRAERERPKDEELPPDPFR
jgi:hypothetical protein